MIPKMLASRSAHGGLTLHIGLLPIKREWVVRRVRPILTRVITSSLLEMSGGGVGDKRIVITILADVYHYFYGYRVFTVDRPRRSGWTRVPSVASRPCRYETSAASISVNKRTRGDTRYVDKVN